MGVVELVGDPIETILETMSKLNTAISILLRLWLCFLSLLQLHALKFQPLYCVIPRKKIVSTLLWDTPQLGDGATRSNDESINEMGRLRGKASRRNACKESRGQTVKSTRELEMSRVRELLNILSASTAGVSALGLRPCNVDALDRPIDDKLYHKALINVQSDDFWYPPYLIGKWNTSLTFDKAIFTEKYTIDELSKNENLPGFSKYSVIFAPDMGKDVNLVRRFAQIDSHPREDHPYNLREIFRAYLGDEATIDSCKYNFQKAPDWFHSPANKWKVTYHDSTGRGVMNLLTQKRNIQVLAGTVETSEFIKQEHIRYDNDKSGKREVIMSDYCVHWKLGESLKQTLILIFSHNSF